MEERGGVSSERLRVILQVASPHSCDSHLQVTNTSCLQLLLHAARPGKAPTDSREDDVDDDN